MSGTTGKLDLSSIARFPVAWGEWMVPRLSLSAEAQLRSNLTVIEREGPDNVPQLVKMACSLAQQNAYQQAIIRQATGHIGALEMAVELASVTPQRPGLIHRLLWAIGLADLP